MPNILFFAGSFYNRNRDFLKTAFSRMYYVHNYQNFINLDYYLNIFQPDGVVLVSAEYTITPTYYDVGYLSEKKFNPIFESAIKEYPFAKIQLPNTEESDIIETALDRKGFENSSIEREGRILSLTLDDASGGGGYRFGYFKKNGKVYDLQIKDGVISCSVDNGRTTFAGGELYLFR